MPIQHLLESRGRFPRLGVIRLGIKVTTGERSYPKAADHFVVPSELADQLGTATPREIDITFPDSEPSRVLDAYYRKYEGNPENPAGGLLVLRCDGVTAANLPRDRAPYAEPCKRQPFDPANPAASRAPCPCGAKAVARLNVVALKGGIGTHQMVVGGEGRIADLMEDLWIGRRAYGRLVGIPAKLVLEPVGMEFRDKDGRRQRREGWAPRIRWQHTYQQALAARGQDPLALEAAPAEVAQGPKALPPAPVDRKIPDPEGLLARREVHQKPPADTTERRPARTPRARPAPAVVVDEPPFPPGPDGETASMVQSAPRGTMVTTSPPDPGLYVTELSPQDTAGPVVVVPGQLALDSPEAALPAGTDALMECRALAIRLDVTAETFDAYLMKRCGPEPTAIQMQEVRDDLRQYLASPSQAGAFKAACRAAQASLAKAGR